jgi:flavin prenyltransferase
MNDAPRRIVVGVTGASGAIYGVRTVRALLMAGCEVHLVVSKFGERLLAEEAGISLAREGLAERVAREEGFAEGLGRLVRHDARDLGAPISSGSFRTAGMVVAPCSAKTLGGIASGYATTLVERAADVCLKERRPLILVVRESPLSLIHLRNMVTVTEAGAIVLPASPAFYQGPRSFEDLGDFVAGRVLNLLGIEHGLFRPWGEE